MDACEQYEPMPPTAGWFRQIQDIVWRVGSAGSLAAIAVSFLDASERPSSLASYFNARSSRRRLVNASALPAMSRHRSAISFKSSGFMAFPPLPVDPFYGPRIARQAWRWAYG